MSKAVSIAVCALLSAIHPADLNETCCKHLVGCVPKKPTCDIRSDLLKSFTKFCWLMPRPNNKISTEDYLQPQKKISIKSQSKISINVLD